MRQLFSDFLAEHGFLPVRSVGTIIQTKETARFQVGEDIMFPPSQCYELNKDVSAPAALQAYIGKRYRLSEVAAESMLNAFMDELNKELEEKGLLTLNQVELYREGDQFSVRAAGAQPFLYPLYARRVIRENKVHEVLVGDVTSNTAVMSEFYSAPRNEKKNRTWLYLLLSIIVVAAVVAAYYYFYSAY